MEHRSESLTKQDRAPASASAESSTIRVTGQVKWFDFTKGYGFIAPVQGGEDILLHQVCVRQSGFKTVQEGTNRCL